MSDHLSGRLFGLSVVAGICWAVKLLQHHVWRGIELFGGVDSLAVGLLLVVAIEYSGAVLVTILALCLFWAFLRGDRPFYQLERGSQTAIVAGLAFLILTPFISSAFHFVVPQPDSGPVAVVLYIARNVSAALLVGGVLIPRLTTRFSSLR